MTSDRVAQITTYDDTDDADEQLEKIRKRCEAAMEEWATPDERIRFITHAREDIPWLIGKIDWLQDQWDGRDRHY